MKVNRFMEIKDNGNISFVKVVVENDITEKIELITYNIKTKTQLDFSKECLERFENAFPEWVDIFEWQIIAEDDLLEYIKDPINTVI